MVASTRIRLSWNTWKICIFVATENKEAARKFLDYLVEAANEALITPETIR